jgi:hypothetical protein
MLVARALKNSQLTCGGRHAYLGDRTLYSRFRASPLGESQLKSSGPLAHSDPGTKRPGHRRRSNHLPNRPLEKNLATSQY